MPERIEIDRSELRQLRLMGATQGVLASYFGCSRWTVSRRLRALDMGDDRTGEQTSGWRGGERIEHYGYTEVQRPDHPRADAEGYVKRSILMWEAYHGRPFPKDREPHHIDGDRTNDDSKNILSLLHSEHSILHRWLERQAKRGGAGEAQGNAKKC